MRRTPVYDPFDDRDDGLPAETPENVRRMPATPGYDRVVRRADVRPIRTARRPAPSRGPDPRVWFVRGAIGVAALAGLWLGLQTMFPVTESQLTQTPAPTVAVPADASSVGAPEPPASQAGAAAQQPAPAGDAQAAPQAAAPAQPAATQPPVEVAPAVADRLPGLPASGSSQPQAAAPAQPAAPPAAPAQPTSAAQQPAGKPTLAPIPPPPSSNAQPNSPAQQAAAQAQQQAAAAAPKPQAPAPPPPAQSTGGPFELAASASPVNPISENAVVTISIKATQNGAPLAGASCMATVYFRTNTIKQPDGGFRTNGNGVASFTLDAKGSTYGHYIPVDVTCSGRGGTVTARTGFTPVRGR